MPLSEDIEDVFDEIDEDKPGKPEEQGSREETDFQPFPEKSPFEEPGESRNNVSDVSNVSDPDVTDLVDDLTGNDEEESEPEFNTEESFAPSKEVKNTKKIMQITALIAGAVLLLVVTVIPQMTKKEPKQQEETGIVDSDEILKQMREYDERDIKRQEERKPRGEIQETPLPKTAEEQQPQQRQEQPGGAIKPRAAGQGRTPGTGGSGHNARKDEEILKQYSEIDPAAAAANSIPGTSNKLARLNSLPQRQGGGGLNIIGAKSDENKEKTSVYNVELKARLKFGVRSSGGNSVVATVSEAKSDFPEGTIFYGEASFNNKRTFVRFTHAQAGDRKIVLDGRAMMGKDPGLPSEVTEIAGQNAESSLKAGAIGVAGQVADNALANVTNGATRGVLNDSTKDLQKQQEEQKKQYEYFVPAGTVFTIYVY